MLLIFIVIVLFKAVHVNSYSHSVTLLSNQVNLTTLSCGGFTNAPLVIKFKKKLVAHQNMDFEYSTMSTDVVEEDDPFLKLQEAVNVALFGQSSDAINEKTKAAQSDNDIDYLAQFPSGQNMRAELFQGKKMVHMPPPQWMQLGHCYLNMTKDYMQTAVNAFFILVEGTLDDVLRLPMQYVLKSARTISMMKLAREKLAATWTVVKGDQKPEDISFTTLEYYRPLFKYVSGREMARLNLLDDRILSYIGTHSDLNRHQVGVVASRYVQENPFWHQSRYLNLMNNLICGVPMNLMRKIPENVYLQLSHQVFYHIKACDPLQRRFYLGKMTKTQVLGKSNSWGARDVARLGLLMTEVEGPELSAISPDAIAALTSHVMLEMSAENLKYLTKIQQRYLTQRPYNLLIKKLSEYDDKLQILNSASKRIKGICSFITCMLVIKKIS